MSEAVFSCRPAWFRLPEKRGVWGMAGRVEGENVRGLLRKCEKKVSELYPIIETCSFL